MKFPQWIKEEEIVDYIFVHVLTQSCLPHFLETHHVSVR